MEGISLNAHKSFSKKKKGIMDLIEELAAYKIRVLIFQPIHQL